VRPAKLSSFGNRTAQSPQSGACPAQESSLTATETYNANNQISDGLHQYDAAGDLIADATTGNFYLYGRRGRICAVASTPVLGYTTMTGYLYDADGDRVAKGTITSMSCDPTANGFQFTEDYVLGPGGEELSMLGPLVNGNLNWQRTNVYGGGKLIGTYDLVGNPQYTPGGSQPQQIPWLHFHLEDALGTRRMQISGMLANLAQPEMDFQSLPFGDQTAAYPDAYADAATEQSTLLGATPLFFTGKERDAESGNDYFGARYYASSMGRFLSPDPLFISPERLADPQSLNLYSYVRNNPLGLTDDTGLDFYLACQTSDHSGCGQVQNGSNSVWVQGQTVDGKFQATDVDMNKQGDTSAGYHDQFGNQYTGTFDQNNGVSFTNTATGATSGRSQFIDGSDNTQLNGSGAFTNISGNFFSDCGGSCQGRASLQEEAPGAFAATESQLNKASAAEGLFDRLFTGAHKPGSQWSDSDGYVRMLENSGKMELHFQRHPTGVDIVNLVLHAVDAIRDRSSGRAAAERDTPLP